MPGLASDLGALALAALRRLVPTVEVAPCWTGLLLGMAQRAPRLVVVLRHAHVVEVLADHEHFTVEPYDAKMRATLGPFVLGRALTDPYRDDIAALRAAIRADDCRRLREQARAAARTAVARAAARGRLDVAGALAHAVVPACVGALFGFAPSTEAGESVARLLEETSAYVFDPFAGLGEQVRARRAGDAIGAHLGAAIAAHPGTDDVIGRLRGLGLAPDHVRALVAGTASGAIVPTIHLFLGVVDRLLDLPPADFARLVDVARTGNDDALWRWLREAARFSPVPPAIQRYCRQATTLGRTTDSPRPVPEGALVLACITSASRDPAVVERPDEFWPERPERQYLLFGAGQHHCLGATPERDIAQALVTEMARPLLALPHLRRSPGASSRPRGSEPFEVLVG